MVSRMSGSEGSGAGPLSRGQVQWLTCREAPREVVGLLAAWVGAGWLS